MEINRNHIFFTGIVLVFLGIQFRMVESATLTSQATRWIEAKIRKAKRSMSKADDGSVTGTSYDGAPLIGGGYSETYYPGSRRIVRPPGWLGFALLAVGAVMAIHAAMLQRPVVG